MRNAGVVLIAFSCLTGLIAAASCSSSTPTSTTGAGGDVNQTNGVGPTSTAAQTSSASTSASISASSAASTGAGGNGAGGTGAGGDGAGGSGPATVCTIPSPQPSMGSCVAFASDAGVEVDAGFDDAGNASATNCNPITNQGCVGTDVCGVDGSGMFYDCQPAGNPANVLVCADCTADDATCGVGGLCLTSDGNTYACAQMCCTDADCGATGMCLITGFLEMDLPSSVGLCVTK